MAVLEELMAEAEARSRGLPQPRPGTRTPRPSFQDAIAGKDNLDVVAEFKRQSPSRGVIRDDADITVQVAAYASGGARAVSVLTEPSRFAGCYDDLRLACQTLSLPVLMKDFVVSERQLEHAAALGASAVLLIARCLPQARLLELARACQKLGVTPLVECHDQDEIRIALQIEEAVLGVNNRDLQTLRVDRERGRDLLASVPADRVVVAESGFSCPADVDAVRGLADAVLVGTALMQSPDPAGFLQQVLS